MRLRKFTARDIPSAMQMVREELGDEAIIVNTVQNKTNKMVEITAAIDDDIRLAATTVSPPAPTEKLTPSEDEIIRTLRFHNTPEPLIVTLVDTWQHKIVHAPNTHPHAQLEALLSFNFTFQPLPLERAGSRIALVGSPGIGKTMTIAKIASDLVMKKQDVRVITTDNTRAGGIEQLKAFTDILGLTLDVATSAQELWQWLQECPPTTRALIDTAGCSPYIRADMEELQALVAVGGFEPVLVLPAGGDASEAADIARAFDLPGLKRLLVTRLDAARRFGGLLAAAYSGGLSFCHASSSARIAGGLKEMSPQLLAALLTQYKMHS